jgi:hypothetical protein
VHNARPSRDPAVIAQASACSRAICKTAALDKQADDYAVEISLVRNRLRYFTARGVSGRADPAGQAAGLRGRPEAELIGTAKSVVFADVTEGLVEDVLVRDLELNVEGLAERLLD